MSDAAEPSDGSNDASPLNRLLDVGVFAPLGFLLGRDQVVSELAAAGRKQVAFSRSLGRAALSGLAKGTKRQPVERTANDAVDGYVVDGYATMTARQVIDAVASCSPAQLAWLRDQETSTKNRVTVIRALDAAIT